MAKTVRGKIEMDGKWFRKNPSEKTYTFLRWLFWKRVIDEEINSVHDFFDAKSERFQNIAKKYETHHISL